MSLLMLQKIKQHLLVQLNYPQFLHLKLKIQSKDPLLKELYKRKVEKHNKTLCETQNQNQNISRHFELNCPFVEDEDIIINNSEFDNFKEPLIKKGIPCYYFDPLKLDFEIKADSINMVMSNGKTFSSAIHLFPCEKLLKTPLRLVNLGTIIYPQKSITSYFDVLLQTTDEMKEKDTSFDYWIHAYSPLIQIQSPGLEPIFIEID